MAAGVRASGGNDIYFLRHHVGQIAAAADVLHDIETGGAFAMEDDGPRREVVRTALTLYLYEQAQGLVSEMRRLERSDGQGERRPDERVTDATRAGA